MVKTAINFDYLHEEQFPYQARYIGWQTAPLHPRLGLGGSIGKSSVEYGVFLGMILKDLKGFGYGDKTLDFPELVLTDKFKNEIGPDLESLTRGLLSEKVVKALVSGEHGLNFIIKRDIFT